MRIRLQKRLDHGRHKLRFPMSLPFNYHVSLFSNNPNSAFRGCISESHSLEGPTWELTFQQKGFGGYRQKPEISCIIQLSPVVTLGHAPSLCTVPGPNKTHPFWGAEVTASVDNKRGLHPGQATGGPTHSRGWHRPASSLPEERLIPPRAQDPPTCHSAPQEKCCRKPAP